VAEVEVWGPTATFVAAQAVPTEAMPARGKTEVAAIRTSVLTTPTPTALPPRSEPTSRQADGQAGTPLPDGREGVATTPELVASPPVDETPVTAVPTPSPSPTIEPTATLPPETPSPVAPDPTPTATLVPTETGETATELPPAESPVTGEGYIVTGAEGANCRVAPGADQEIISPLLEEGSLVVTIGEPVDGWQQVACNGQTGFVFAELVSDTLPAQPTEPVEPTEPVGTEVLLEPGSDQDPTPENETGEMETPGATEDLPDQSGEAPDETLTPEPTASEETFSREIVVLAAGDTSVAEADPLALQSPDAVLNLSAGGEAGALVVLTFPIEGVGAGTVVDARLVITGSGESGGEGGQLRVIEGVWFDETTASWNDVANAGGEDGPWIGWIEPGGRTVIDVTGVVSADGTISFVLEGTPGQVVAIASTESGSPAYLVITVEEGVVPDPE
ncbi:MAG TPA: hypothetical protein VGR08_11210, partial [Thermomicrobiales bacterium]|nr:hypothetical protein [Thermomicrobiales bacterium]